MIHGHVRAVLCGGQMGQMGHVCCMQMGQMGQSGVDGFSVSSGRISFEPKAGA